MGLCEFCGEQAGFMRRSHRACAELFDQGVNQIATTVADNSLSVTAGVRRIQALAQHHRVEGENLEEALETAWVDCIKKELQEDGVSPAEEMRLDALLGTLGLSDIKAERRRIWNQVLQRRRRTAEVKIEELVHEGMELAAAAHAGASHPRRALADIEAAIRENAVAARIEAQELQSLVTKCMEGEMERMAEDGHLSHEEEHAVQALCQMFGIQGDDQEENGIWSQLAKLAVLRDLAEGSLPARFAQVQVPFRMMKSETLIWLFDNVEYHAMRTRREFRGGSTGISVRVARGIYLRQSAFKGRPLEVNEFAYVDTGLLGITTKHMYFTGPARSFRIRHSKIVSLTPFTDGISLTRDTANAKPESFRVEDGWFIYNLLRHIEIE